MVLIYQTNVQKYQDCSHLIKCLDMIRLGALYSICIDTSYITIMCHRSIIKRIKICKYVNMHNYA